MVVKVDCSMKAQVESFLEYIKARAKDPAHTKNGDAIADFIDGFMVFELKRLGKKDEDYIEEIQFPDELVLEPLKNAKLRMDEIFNDFLKDPSGKTKTVTPTIAPTSGTSSATPTDPTAAKQPRTGNGHKSNKKRGLADSEKDHIRAQFLAVNGQIAEDTCVEIKKHSEIGTDVSIFQVTGFVTYMHRQIAMGEFEVTNMNSYLDFLKSHRALWATYDSDKYRAMRADVAARKAA
jgi:hypothetical protein